MMTHCTGFNRYHQQGVLIPKYYVEGDPVFGTKDIQETNLYAKEIMESLLMSDKRTIVAVNPLGLNFGGGGIHCITLRIR
jgi:hypothetical protein